MCVCVSVFMGNFLNLSFPLFHFSAEICVSTILFCDGCTFFRDDGDDNDEDVDLCTEKNTSRDDDDARVFLFSLFFIVVVDVATAVASVLSSYQQERVFKARATF